MLIGNQLPAHRRVEQDMHQGFEMGFALRCQIEFFQPIFDQQRFDILNRKIPPLWLDMVFQPAAVPRRGRLSLREFFRQVPSHECSEGDWQPQCLFVIH